jgi:hypothetical protein
MQRSALLALAGLAALPLAGLLRSAAPAAAGPQGPAVEEKVVVVIPRKDPAWESVILDHDRPLRLLTVPPGRRFVLTDMILTSHEEFRQQEDSPEDRMWLEDVDRDSRRQVVFDALRKELPLPLHLETGIVFGPGHEVWMNYRFAEGGKGRKGGKGDWTRRLTWSGYFEDAASD